MYRVYLQLGSNLGNREEYLNSATIEIIDNLLPDYLEVESLDEAVKSSKIMETEPIGFDSKDMFLNQTISILTELAPLQVLECCLAIERGLGRVRGEVKYDSFGKRIYESRTIDIDILVVEEFVDGQWREVRLSNDNLTLPHPQINERPFSKKLLKEIRK